MFAVENLKTDKPFLDALSGVKAERPPFWFMRQAGRYLPEYREMRGEKGGFLAMAMDPASACEITMQPIRRFGMDGAIIFSDILTVPMALGQHLEFVEGEGPKLGELNVGALNYAGFSKLDPVYEALGNVKTALQTEGFDNTALIGFAGAPWTVATYMVEGGSSRDFMKTKLMAYQDPEGFSALMNMLVEATATYLINQINAGAEAVQIFDSWAGALDADGFKRWCVQPTRQIVEMIRAAHPHTPIIGFPKGAGYNYLSYAHNTGVTAIGLDQHAPTDWAARALQSLVPVQGNLDPFVLMAGGDALVLAVEKIMSDLSGGPFIFNLGGPDSKNAIQPFLMNFFMDKNIISLPIPFRCILANMISKKRSKREAGESYGELGDKSPLLENTNKQAKALEKALKGRDKKFKTFVCMRYWHPMEPQVVREVRDWGADKIVLLPLYPQFSTTTTKSSLEQWNKALHQAGMNIPSSMVCCYHANDGFVKASAENIRMQYDQAIKDGFDNPRVLFSAHGLPEKIIKNGDPYQWQCEQTAEAIVKELAIEGLDYQYCYQSRVGPMKWIGPSVDEALAKAAEDKKAVVIYPHAFTQEHVETLVELDIEYKEAAEDMGQKGYYRAQTVGTHGAFIEGLAGLVQAHMDKDEIFAEGFKSSCPSEFEQCCMRQGTI